MAWCSTGKKDLELLQTLEEYWGRYESDDIYYMMITLINKFVTRVPELQSMQVSPFLLVCQCSIACCCSLLAATVLPVLHSS